MIPNQEVKLFLAGRGVGKSVFFDPVPLKIMDQAIVDGETWYVVQCNKEIANWILNNHNKSKDKLWSNLRSWYHYHFVEMHEKFFTLVSLK